MLETKKIIELYYQ